MHLGIGQVVVIEEVPVNDHRLLGLDLTARVGPKLDFRLEVAGFLSGICERHLGRAADFLVAGLAGCVLVAEIEGALVGGGGTHLDVEAGEIGVAVLRALLGCVTVKSGVNHVLR